MRLRPLRLAWLLMLPLAMAVPANASAAATVPAERALAATVTQMTGLAPSALTAQAVCAPPEPGRASCQAQALVLRAGRALARPRVHAWHSRQARAAVGAAITPAITPPEPGTPAYLQQAYDMTYLSQTGGSGDTVAIVDAYDDPNAETDLATYRSTYGLAPCTAATGCFTKVNQGGNPSPLPAQDDSWEMEISLDLDAVSALCPQCKILLVEANSNTASNLQAALGRAAAVGAKQISNSWTMPSTSVPHGKFTFTDVAVVAASGDHGFVGSGNSNYPAALADVTAAGGTSLAAAGDGVSPRGFAESAWSPGADPLSAGSGCDLNVTKPSYQSDSGCTGRAYSDLSADADPQTGLLVYDSAQGGWAVIGGTSLASPLIAGYLAAAGITAVTPQWAYAKSALLNDPISGWNGTCATVISYICAARTGYDGPTGVGSISGAIALGAPGLGGPSFGSGTSSTYMASVGSQTAVLQAGVYPNGLDTSYWWEYGTTTAYGQRTATVDIGSGQAPVPVSADLGGLSAATAYRYRLVAQNSLGTSFGYDYSLTTTAQSAINGTGTGNGSGRGNGTQTVSTISAPPAGPSNATAPSISGTPRRRVSLRAGLGSWNPAPSGYAIQWQRASGGAFADISGAEGSSYTPVKADEHGYLRIVVSARNASGSASAVSAPVGPVSWNPPVRGSAPVITGAARQGSLLRYRAPVWRATTPDTTFSMQWKRCRRNGTGCRPIRSAGAGRYRLTGADAGHRIVVSVTATNPDASITTISAPSAIVVAVRPAHPRAPR